MNKIIFLTLIALVFTSTSCIHEAPHRKRVSYRNYYQHYDPECPTPYRHGRHWTCPNGTLSACVAGTGTLAATLRMIEIAVCTDDEMVIETDEDLIIKYKEPLIRHPLQYSTVPQEVMTYH